MIMDMKPIRRLTASLLRHRAAPWLCALAVLVLTSCRRAGGHKGRPYGAVSSSMGLYIMMAWFSVMNSSPSSAPSIPSTRRNRVLCRVKPPQYSPRISCSFS